MNKELSQRQLLEIAHNQSVDVPIMNYRIVGGRVELFLYGGQVISSPAGDSKPASMLEKMSVKELYTIASALEISGRSKMGKDELVEAILLES